MHIGDICQVDIYKDHEDCEQVETERENIVQYRAT